MKRRNRLHVEPSAPWLVLACCLVTYGVARALEPLERPFATRAVPPAHAPTAQPWTHVAVAPDRQALDAEPAMPRPGRCAAPATLAVPTARAEGRLPAAHASASAAGMP